MTQVITVFQREFKGYFRSPIGYVLLAAFTVIATICWFFVVRFFRYNSASMDQFFALMPWIFTILVPAAAMRLWAEEKRSGTIELLLTLPITTTQAVFGKFLAAWAFIGLAVVLTFPCALTVAYLGNPDWGVIFASYFGTILMAASFLGVCSLTSALTRNQVISFILGFFVCLVLTLLGYSSFSDLLSGYAPVWLVDTIANFSFTTHFQSMTLGLVDVGGVVFFASVCIVTLIANIVVLER